MAIAQQLDRHPPTTTDTGERRGSRAIAAFGTWMLIGLFLDGWAHQNSKPETFFSPWHGVLYSGFVAAVAWFTVDGWRHRDGSGATVDKLGTAGLVTFVVGAVGDGIWHTLFGIEADIEALLSPTHLALMIGGGLMVSAPFRVAWRTTSDRPTFRELLPAILSLTLVTSLVLFFLMYLSAAPPIALRASRDGQAWGIAAVLVRSTVMLAPSLLLLRRWTPPMGTFTVLFTVPALALSGLEAFEAIALVLPFLVAGVVADVLVARTPADRLRTRRFGSVVMPVCWLGYFAVHAVVWGVHWPAEIWTGAVVFATGAGVVGSLLVDGLAVDERAIAA